MALTQTQVSQLYVSIIGRASEGNGNTFWQGASDMDTAATSMLESDAAQAYFGTSLDTNQAFIEHIYQNTLGKTVADDPGGIAFWVDALDGGMSKGAIVTSLIDAAMSPDVTDKDAQNLFINQVAVSDYCADSIPTSDPSDLSAFTGYITGVTSDAASVDTVKATIDGDVPVSGETFTLTTGTDSFVGTADNDLFEGAAGTLATADTILDSSSTDADVMNVEVTSNNIAARIQNVETINVNGTYVTTGLDLANTSGTTDLNLSAGILGATATVTNASSLNALNINAGDNVSTLSVTATASGTRDTVNVDAGSATNVTVAGGAGADNFALDLASGAAATLNGGASIDSYSVNVGATATLTGNTATETMTINADADSVITLGSVLTGTYAAAATNATTVTGAGNVTVKGTNLQLSGNAMSNTGTGTLTVEVTNAPTAAVLNQIQADVVVLDAANVGTVTVNGNSTVNLTDNVSGTIDVDNAGATAMAAGAGTLLLNASESQTSITTGGNVGVVIINATPDEASDTASGAEITLTTLDTSGGAETVIVQGSENLTITTLTNGAGTDVLSATTMTGELTIGTTAAAGTFALGSGNDTVTVGNVASTIHGNAGDDKLTGGTAADTINGNAGDDTIVGSGGVDTLNGGDGDDTITGGTAVDTIDGGAGNDKITAGADNDKITAGAGDDTVIVAASDDINTIALGDGADTVVIAVGGALDDGTDEVNISDFVVGTDKLVLTGTTTDTTIDLSAVSVTSDVYTIATGDAVVTLTGNTATDMVDSIQLGSATTALTLAASSTVTAGAFDDNIVTGTGTNVVIGGAGDDILTGLAGSTLDTFTGGIGNDTFDANSTTATTIKDLSGSDVLKIDAAAALVKVAVTADWTADSTTIQEGAANTVTVMTLADGIDVNLADATVVGVASGYTINAVSTTGVANTLASTIVGSDGADVITGGAGADTITAGEGTDDITGGEGDDVINLNEQISVVDNVNLGFTAATGIDTITNFSIIDTFTTTTAGTAYLDATANDYSAGATLADAATLAIADGSGGGAIDVVAFDYGTDRYIVIDQDSSDAYTAAADTLICITGTSDAVVDGLTAGNFI